MNSIKMGNFSKFVENDVASNSITFCVTQDCQLRCRYCYMVQKNKLHRMEFNIAQKAIDYVLNHRELYSEKAVVWEFIGGEPLLEIDLIDRICDYIKQKTYMLNHPWFSNYIFNISTNGLLYSSEKVQNFINKNKGHISIGISIDGNKKKHDNQRVYPDGTGSYENVVKNVPLWIEQFGENIMTKSTFSHGDIAFLKDSIINLWNLGIKEVAANVVFEDVWDDNDPIIFEQQLKELADYIIEKKIWNDVNVRFFDPYIGFPLDKAGLNNRFCGSGKMLSIDCDGKFYPCTRFMGFTLNKKVPLSIGDVENGISLDRLRPFKELTVKSISKPECLNCEVASGCAACTGLNYDESKFDSIFERATYICEMHKANVRACEYFWNKYSQVTKKQSPRDEIRISKLHDEKKYLQIITEDNITSHCNYSVTKKQDSNKMSKEMFGKIIKFCETNNFIPVLLGDIDFAEDAKSDSFLWINDKKVDSDNLIIIHDNKVIKPGTETCILIINKENIQYMLQFIDEISKDFKYVRINIMLRDFEKWNDIDINLYEKELDKLMNFVITNRKESKIIDINVLSDDKYSRDCGAGNDLLAIAPNGKFYICPGFYFDYVNMDVGDIDNGINKGKIKLFSQKREQLESNCNYSTCNQCVYLNKKETNELFICSKNQEVKTQFELHKTKCLENELLKLNN